MNESNTNTTQAVDMVAQDFKTSAVVVSLLANLTVFVAWLVYMMG